MTRWWVYQRERFPLAAHAPLIAAFSGSAVSYSALLRGGATGPSLRSWVVAFAVSLGSFLLLRIADEFKDAEEDARYRPYRPVPRGLVTLRELGLIGVGVGAVQLALTTWLGLASQAPAWEALLALLVLSWTYFALMSKEFFARAWLKARPVIYLVSHMGIMPLVDWLATGCDWVPAGAGMPAGLGWFLTTSFCNGVVIELGRKIRAPSQEETGVETYSVLWGRRTAVAAWLLAMATTWVCAVMAANRVGFGGPFSVLMGAAWLAAVWVGRTFLRGEDPRWAKRIELTAGLWTLGLYLLLGFGPRVWR